MADKDAEVKIEIKADVDEASFRETEAKVKQMTEAASDAASPATKEQTPAVQAETAAQRENASAAQAVSAAKEQVAQAAKDAAAGLQELEAVWRELQQAQAEQEAQDAQAIARLQSLQKARGAHASAMTRQNQAQLAAQARAAEAAGASGALAMAVQQAGAAANGTVPSFTAASAAATRLMTAMQNGIGKVGIAMLGLQAAEMGLNMWLQKREAQMQRVLAKQREEHEALNRERELYRELAAEQRNTLAERTANNTRIAFDEAAKRAAEMSEETQAAHGHAEAAAAAQRALMEAQAAAAKEQVNGSRLAGKLTEEQARLRLVEIEQELAARLETVEAEGRARRERAAVDNAEIEAERLRQTEAAYKRQQAQWEPLQVFALPDEATLAQLEKRLKELDEHDPEDAEARAAVEKEKDKITEQAKQMRKVLQGMGVSIVGGEKEIIEYVRSLQQQNKEAKAQVEEQRRRTSLAREAADAAEAQGAVEAKAAAEQQSARRLRIQAEREAARIAGKDAEWLQVQQGSLAEQEKWLRETAAAFAEGSDAARKWNAELKKAQSRKVQEALDGLAEQFEVSQSYAVKDNRTLAEIHAADEKALEQRRQALRAMAKEPGLDASTMKRINAALKETDAQVHGVRHSMQEAAVEASKAVKALQPLGQKALAGAGMQTALKRAEQAYVKLANRAEKQAQEGDTDGFERTMRAMQRTADHQERLTGHSGKAASHQKEVEGHLRSVLLAHRKGERSTELQAKASDRAAKAAEKQAREAEKQQRDAKKQARATGASSPKPATDTKGAQAAKGEDLSATVEQLRDKLAEATSALSELRGAVSGLQGAAERLATEAVAAASAARSGAEAANTQLTAMKTEVRQLRTAVDRMKRKG